MTIKAYALADFVAKFTPSLNDAATQPKNTPEVAEHTVAASTPYAGDFLHLHIDESSNY